MTRRQLISARILFAVYLVAVAVLCFVKFPESQEVDLELWGIPFDKVVHFLMFFPFPLLACLAFGCYPGKPEASVLKTVLAFLSGCAFAAFTELVQFRLPWRSGDPADFRADAVALGIGSVIVLILVLAKKKS